jgi:hypothetical protein
MGPILDGNTTMTFGVAEEGYQVHFGSEWQADGFEIKPCGIDVFVQDPGRAVDKVSAVVGEFQPSSGTHDGFVLTAMDVDQGVREVR